MCLWVLDRSMQAAQHDTVAAQLRIPIRKLLGEKPKRSPLGLAQFSTDTDASDEAAKQLRRDLAIAEDNEVEEREVSAHLRSMLFLYSHVAVDGAMKSYVAWAAETLAVLKHLLRRRKVFS